MGSKANNQGLANFPISVGRCSRIQSNIRLSIGSAKIGIVMGGGVPDDLATFLEGCLIVSVSCLKSSPFSSSRQGGRHTLHREQRRYLHHAGLIDDTHVPA